MILISIAIGIMGAIIGNLIADEFGMSLGAAIGVALPGLYSGIRHRHSPTVTLGHRRRASRTSLAANIIAFAMVVYFPLLALYGAIVAAQRNDLSFVEWMRSLSWLTTFLSTHIPSITRVPTDLIAKGHTEWALPTQHMLTIGWVSTELIGFLCIVDCFVFDRQLWANQQVWARRSEFAWMAVGLLLGILMFSLFLFFGYVPSEGPRSGPVSLWGIALGLWFVIFFEVGFLGCLSALLNWSPAFDAERDAFIAKRNMKSAQVRSEKSDEEQPGQ